MTVYLRARATLSPIDNPRRVPSARWHNRERGQACRDRMATERVDAWCSSRVVHTRDSGRAVALSWHPASATGQAVVVPPPVAQRLSERLRKIRARGAVPPDPPSASSGTVGVAVDEGVELVVAFLASPLLAGAAIVHHPGATRRRASRPSCDLAGCRAVVVDSRRDHAATARVEEAARQSGRALTLVEAADLVPDITGEGEGEGASGEDEGASDGSLAPDAPDAGGETGGGSAVSRPAKAPRSHVAFTSGSASGKPRGSSAAHESLAHYEPREEHTHGLYHARLDGALASAHTSSVPGGRFRDWPAHRAAMTCRARHLAESWATCLAESRATHSPRRRCWPASPRPRCRAPRATSRCSRSEASPCPPAPAGGMARPRRVLGQRARTHRVRRGQTSGAGGTAVDADRIGEPLGAGCRLLVAELGGDGDGHGDGDAADAADGGGRRATPRTGGRRRRRLRAAIAPVTAPFRRRGERLERLLELWIAGPQVGIGYARDAAASRRRFFVDARSGRALRPDRRPVRVGRAGNRRENKKMNAASPCVSRGGARANANSS